MYIKVRVRPGSKREVFERVDGDTVNLQVKEKAENNAANRRVLEIIAEHYGINRTQVRIVSGHHSGSKILSIPDEL